jgi:hypothetical protein
LARGRVDQRTRWWQPTLDGDGAIGGGGCDGSHGRSHRSAWCREQGLYAAELDAWKRDAIAGLGEPRAASAVEARQDRRRVKELERELHRKDKALAETAALLVLTKKLSAVFRDGEDV